MPRTTADLSAELGRCRLLEPAQLAELPALLVRFPDPRDLARELLHRGWLTAYQANQLLQNRGHELLLGSYVLLERLGEGGMGQVFKARNWKLGRIVALKVIRKERLASPDAVRRFQREVRAAAQLDHPHIVRALDADQVGDTHFLVLEHVEGADLARLVKQHGPLPVAQACDCVRQAALGLQHAHERGLVHRDVKPSNLLVTREGLVKVLDLGLARLCRTTDDADSGSTLTGEGTVMGTLDYLAPEQARDAHAADIRADLYSLGCTLYHLLTGRAPFAGGTAAEKIYRHQFQEPPPLEHLRPEVPADVAVTVRRLMAKRPEDRFRTPADVAAALACPVPVAAAGAATMALPAGAAERADPAAGTTKAPWSSLLDPPAAPEAAGKPRRPAGRRRRWGLAAGGAALLAAALLAAYLGWPRGPRPTSGPAPVPAAEADWKPLTDAAADAAADPAAFRRRILEYRVRYNGTPWAGRAAVLLGDTVARLPSPLDRLDRAQIPPEQRFAWQPEKLVAVLGEHRRRHWGNVSGVTFSPDGKLLASVAILDGTVRLWDAATMRERAVLSRPPILPMAVAFSPDGKTLAWGGWEGAVLWDLGTAEPAEKALLNAKPAASSLAFSPDGKRLAAGCGDAAVRLWDLGGEKPRERATLKGHTDWVRAVAFAPDGKTLASASLDRTIRLWDLTGAEPRQAAVIEGHTGPVEGVAFAPDGRLLASGGTADGVRLWDLDGEKPRERVALGGGAVVALTFSPNGTMLAASAQPFITLWKLDRGGARQHASFRVSQGAVAMVAFAPDGSTLAAGIGEGAVRLWDVTGDAPQERHALDLHRCYTPAVAFAPDGTTLAAPSLDGDVQLWDLTGEAPKEQAVLRGQREYYGMPLAFAPDGARLAVGDRETVWLWDRSASEPTKKALTAGQGGPAFIVALAFAPDGKTLAAGNADAVVRLWDLTGTDPRERAVLRGHEGGRHITSLAFSPDGRTLASASFDRTVRLWDLAAPEPRLRVVLRGHDWGVRSVAFSPDGRRLASADQGAFVRLWDLSGEAPEGQTLHHGSGETMSVAFAPDGRTLVSAGTSGSLLFWEPASGKKQDEWKLPGVINSVTFAPDGRHLATANGNGTVYVYRLAPPPGRSRP